MARTPTNQIPLGFKAIEFDLPDVITGGKVSLNQVSKKNGLVVIFICNHCPYVIHVIDQIVKIANDYLKKDIGFVAINSNDVVNYPDDDPIKMKALELSSIKEVVHAIIKDVIRKEHRQNKDWMKTVPQRNDRD